MVGDFQAAEWLKAREWTELGLNKYKEQNKPIRQALLIFQLISWCGFNLI